MKVWKIRRLKDKLYKGTGADGWNWSENGHPFMSRGAAMSNASQTHKYEGK
jgi:hypothetical protein